jgi:formylglycine-generating enzyme required for sulfatase activity
MANKDNIAFLTRYQMRVLYYKCKEGATHEEIAAILGRDVNTIQYHMTRIYTVLEIKKPSKTREAMESELKNEIGPIIRAMFPTYDDVKIWAPVPRNTTQGEKEVPDEDADEPEAEETVPPYIPPPSVQKLLGNPENGAGQPTIMAPPPPPRRRINWWMIIGLTVSGLLSVIVWIGYGAISTLTAKPTETPVQPIVYSTEPSSIQIGTPVTQPASHPSPMDVTGEMIDPKDGMVLVRIPAGEFPMGSADRASPPHTVYLDDYWIDKTEVSNAQYAMCVAEGECTLPANNRSSLRESYYDNAEYADYPVIFVGWEQAATYCAWADRHLPTEAQWEKAARGTDGRIYPWGNTFDGTLLNYCDASCQNSWKDGRFEDGYIETSPIGEYPRGASPFGVLDMAGNVFEWVADWYAPYSQDYQANPIGPDSGVERVMRGGAWGDDVNQVRSDVRSNINPNNWMDFIGFRCAR